MNPNRLQVGIDFSQKRADFCLLFPDGQPLLSHQAFANSRLGYQKARQMLLDSLQAYSFAGLDVSGEATSYYWFPFFWQMAHDAELRACDLSLFLLNPRQVHWFKKSLPPDDGVLRSSPPIAPTPSTSPNAPAPVAPRPLGTPRTTGCPCVSTPVCASIWRKP